MLSPKHGISSRSGKQKELQKVTSAESLPLHWLMILTKPKDSDHCKRSAAVISPPKLTPQFDLAGVFQVFFSY